MLHGWLHWVEAQRCSRQQMRLVNGVFFIFLFLISRCAAFNPWVCKLCKSSDSSGFWKGKEQVFQLVPATKVSTQGVPQPSRESVSLVLQDLGKTRSL